MISNEIAKILKKYNIDINNEGVQAGLQMLDLSEKEAQYNKITTSIDLLPGKVAAMQSSGKHELEIIDEVFNIVSDLKHDYISLSDTGRKSFAERMLEHMNQCSKGEQKAKYRLGGHLAKFNISFNGLQPGVHVIGGKPGAGKSTMCHNITNNIWDYNKNPPRIRVLSLDDKEEAAGDKIIANRAFAYQNSLYEPQQDKETQNRIGRAINYFMEKAKNEMIDMVTLSEVPTLRDLENYVDSEYKKANGDIVFIIDAPRNLEIKKFFKDENAKAEYLAMTFKRLFLTYNVPFILTFETNKAAFNKDYLEMSDLYGAAKWPYAAETVTLIFPKDQKAFNAKEDMTVCINIDKTKFSDTKGMMYMRFENGRATFKAIDYNF